MVMAVTFVIGLELFVQKILPLRIIKFFYWFINLFMHFVQPYFQPLSLDTICIEVYKAQKLFQIVVRGIFDISNLGKKYYVIGFYTKTY